MARPTVIALAVLATGLVACTPREERAELARDAVVRGLERGDREAALAAVEDLRGSLPDTADSLLEIARLLVRSGDAPRAGWLLEEGVQRFPARDDLRVALARVSLLLGNPSRAREVALPVPTGSEQHAAALVLRAQAELHLGDLEQALETLASAEALYPDRPEARLVRISTLLSERRQDEARAAIADARAALAGDDEETVALRRRLDVTLAQIQAQQGQPDAALATLEGLLADDVDDVLAWRALVQVLAQQQRSAEALPRLDAALAEDGVPPELHALAAQVHAALGHDEEAEAALRRFVALSPSPAAYLPLVELHSRRGDASAALAVLDEAIAAHPDEPTLRLLRSEALLAEARLDEARTESARFRAATFEDDPQVAYLEARLALAAGDARGAADRLRRLAPELDRAATQFWLGRALEESGDVEGARRRYVLAQRRDPSWTAPGAALIALEQRRGDWRAVAAHARGLVERSPHEIGAWIALVEALEHAGEGEAAEAVARRCLERFEGRAEPQLLLAKSLRAQGRTDDALAALDEARRIAPGSAVEAERILTLGMGGRVEEGLRLARAAVAREPDAAELQAALASLLFAAGAAGEGASAVDRALALAPDDPRPLRVRCEFRAATQDWSGARGDCLRYLEARPGDAGAHFILGVTLYALGDTEGAAAAYRRAAELDERDPRARNNLAELLAATGDLDGALAVAQEAYQLDETNPYVKDTLGALYLEKGLAIRAIGLLEEAHAGLPDHTEVALNLAAAYRGAGRPEEARLLLAKLQRELEPSDPLRPRVDDALGALP